MEESDWLTRVTPSKSIVYMYNTSIDVIHEWCNTLIFTNTLMWNWYKGEENAMKMMKILKKLHRETTDKSQHVLILVLSVSPSVCCRALSI